MPLISIIVPVYKVEQELDKCVESILAQTFKGFELILIDDGSPDNCPAMCDEWAKKDDRIVVIHQKNGGLSAARNAGIDWAFSNSDSEWITFIDSDDWVHNEYLEKLYTASRKYHTDSVVANNSPCQDQSQCFESESELKSEKVHRNELFSLKYYNVNVVSAWAKLYKKSLWHNIRFPIGKLHEDRYTTHKVLCQCSDIAVIHEPIYYYYIRNESITHSNWNPKRLDDLDAIREQFNFFKKNNMHDAVKRTAYDHIWVLYNMLNELDKIAPQYNNYRRKLKLNFKITILKYRKPLKESLNKHIYLYETAFPCLMYLYWTGKGIQNRIKTFWSRKCRK